MSKEILDFLSSREKKPISEIDQKYFSVEEEYAKIFGHRVPTEILPLNATREKITEAMEACIKSKQDKLLEILKANVEDGYLY